eukprot:TRINITY_DN112404_c0_g1_i1.p1 TRINITY_DN112404_c0_g1~~TRINITY_DN112404_c0_g1_i1.p1  ORF type:complete len:349 (+),score=121.43 TRINITY_DN112404_c0_g1_i1:159-1205(+)
MGKGGKPKGFRPPSGDGPSCLFGDVSHLSGNTIASPVQLRAEGLAMPKNHMNFEHEWKRTRGKGKFGPAQEEKQVEEAPTPSGPCKTAPGVNNPYASGNAGMKKEVKSEVKEENLAFGVYEFEPEVPEAPAMPNDVPTAPAMPMIHDGMTEIEKRRAALVSAAKVATGAETEIERRKRLAAEAQGPNAKKTSLQILQEAAAKARQLAQVKKEEEEVVPERKDRAQGVESAAKRLKMDLAAELAAASKKTLAATAAPKASGAAPAFENNTGLQAAFAAAAAAGPAAGSQKTVQDWAAKVNALGTGNTELTKKCREYVRKRILKAHATGSLHSTDWDKEFIPTLDQIENA